MTLQLIGLGTAWLACGYRLWVSFREPPTLWRTAFTVGIVCAALGVTLQSFSPQVDALTAPSVGSLLNHLVIIVGLASVQVYVATLRRDTPQAGLLLRVGIVAAAAEAVTVISWALAPPFHSGLAEHYAVYATNVWVLVYFLTFWGLLAVTMIAVANFCLLEQRGAPSRDQARRVSLGLIGLGAVGGLLYAGAAAAGAIYIAVTRILDDGPLMASSRLIGPSIGLLGVGILALLVVPPLETALRARRRLRVLRALWLNLQQAVPRVRLGGADSGRLAAPAEVERAVIEMRDALEVLLIDPPANDDVEAVATRLVERLNDPLTGVDRVEPSDVGQAASRRPAAAFLPASRTLREDTEQLYMLALAYRRQQRGRRVDASQPAAVPGAPA